MYVFYELTLITFNSCIYSTHKIICTELNHGNQAERCLLVLFYENS